MNRLILGLMINLHLRGAIAALHALEAAQSKGFGQSSARVSSISDWRTWNSDRGLVEVDRQINAYDAASNLT